MSGSTQRIWKNLLFNFIIPMFILTRFSGEEFGDARISLLLALAFPLYYGIRELVGRRTFPYLSLLGVIGVILTGWLALTGSEPWMFACREAALTFILGLATLITAPTRFSIWRKFFVDLAGLHENTIQQNAHAQGNLPKLRKANLWFGIGFAALLLLSAAANFFLTLYVLGDAGDPARLNRELGRLMLAGNVFIFVPLATTAYWMVKKYYRALRTLTGLNLSEMKLPSSGEHTIHEKA